MKARYWKVNTNGDVVSTPYADEATSVQAKNKAEAQREINKAFLRTAEEFPELRVKNGAYALIYSSSSARKNTPAWTLETGRLDRVTTENRVFGLCMAGFSSLTEARKAADNNYYASEQYLSASQPNTI